MNEYPSLIHKIQGTIEHRQVAGDIVEGIVMLLSRGHETTLKKYKFPAYTARTMGLRPLLEGKHRVSLNSAQADAKFERWSQLWCITAEGKRFWIRQLKRAAKALQDNELHLSKNDKVKAHIRAMDFALKQVRDRGDLDIKCNDLDEVELKSDLLTGTIVIVAGPIGAGKSTFAEHLASSLVASGISAVHIDGDVMDLSLAEVLNLGHERNDYTRWKVCWALMNGNIPVVSTGGGVFMHQGKNMRFDFRDSLSNIFAGCQFRIICVIPSLDINNRQVRKVDGIPDLGAYNRKDVTIDSVKRRLEMSEWTLPVHQSEKDFLKMIVDKSFKNMSIAELICDDSEFVFTYPIVTSEDFKDGIFTRNFACSDLRESVVPLSHPLKGTFRQKRILARIMKSNDCAVMFDGRFHHVTLKFDQQGFEVDMKDIQEDELKYCKQTVGTHLKLFDVKQPNKKGGKKRGYIEFIGINNDEFQKLHVTINCGDHAARLIGDAYEGVLSGTKRISLAVGRGHGEKLAMYLVNDIKEYENVIVNLRHIFCVS